MMRDRKSIRLPSWDYSSAGIYFITICCYENKSYFGEIVDNKMILNELGIMASSIWKEIPAHFSHVFLDEYVIMPNHIHGILILDYSRVETYHGIVGTRHGVSLRMNDENNVGSCHGMTLPGSTVNQFLKPVKNSVSVIIGQYKSTFKRWCNKNGYETFRWQPRFYDHIMRYDNSIDHVRYYIKMNPCNWDLDKKDK